MEQPLLSVIVAVYKTEEFFERCLNSLFASEYKNLEILLIDDGSPDNCPKLCDEYAGRDQRIKVIHKENGGGHSAKNLGIEIANGEYIAICDNDDMVPPDAYRLMMEKAVETKADVVRGTVRRTYSDTGEERLFYRNAEDSFMTKLIGFQGAIYRTAMLQENKIKLGPFRLGDDMCFMSQVVRYAKNVQYIDAITYEYMIRPSNSKGASAIQNANRNFPHYYDDFLWRNWVLSYVDSNPDMKEQYGNQLGPFCKVIDSNWLSYSQEEREKCFDELKRMIQLIDWDKQDVNPKGYLQIDVKKLAGMNEAAFTKYLKHQYQVVRPVKEKIKKILGR
ncbi:MAG: glycosyltransferase family 2 protein [Roseburia sp.]